jgi:hypothetical protein
MEAPAAPLTTSKAVLFELIRDGYKDRFFNDRGD